MGGVAASVESAAPASDATKSADAAQTTSTSVFIMGDGSGNRVYLPYSGIDGFLIEFLIAELPMTSKFLLPPVVMMTVSL